MSPTFSTQRLFTRRGAPLLLISGALGAALLAGCGGGGGNGNSGGGTTGTTGTGTGTNTGTNTGPTQGNADVIGKVTDMQGNGVPGVSIIPDTGGSATLTLGQGGYRLNNLTGNVVHRITASVQQGSVQYTGSTQVLTQGGFLVSNANILLSPTTHQATISGTVRDTSGAPISGAEVFLALPNGSAQAVGNYSSLIAFTDAGGIYTLTNVPSDAPSGGTLTISASAARKQNGTAPLSALQAGGVYNHDFTLSASTGAGVGVPAIVSVTTATEPVDAQSGRAIQAHAAGTSSSVYDQIRRSLSPAYARTADRTAATGKRLRSHAVGDYAIQTDIAFDNPTSTGSVIGDSVYRTGGSTVPTENDVPYDFLQDPLANYFTDLTFSTNTSTTVAGSQYNFALSATNTDGTQTALSPVLSVTPLGPLTLTAPTVGQIFTTTATLTWGAATGATKYYVFIYNQYPTIGTSATATAGPLAAGTLTYAATGLTAGVDYYAVVVGAADPVETVLPTATSSPAVTNGALTFSQITRFHVQ